jgi:hypothetical protein
MRADKARASSNEDRFTHRILSVPSDDRERTTNGRELLVLPFYKEDGQGQDLCQAEAESG